MLQISGLRQFKSVQFVKSVRNKSEGQKLTMAPPSNWGRKNIPNLRGKIAVVTGPTSGLGFEVAYTLADHNAKVIIAARPTPRALLVVEKIKDDFGFTDDDVRYIPVDLGNLESIEDFAAEFGQSFKKLDILVNNAGVLAVPERTLTDDGYELQFGTNYLGHYALTAHLRHYLEHSSSRARVVNVASRYARKGVINFDDLMGEKSYKPWGAYAQSKLANLLFTKELQRKSDAYGWGILSLAAHPGFARTNLFSNGPGDDSCIACLSTSICGNCWGQSASWGALPVLYAATAQDVTPGGYYGPRDCFELKGRPREVQYPKQCDDNELAAKLWNVSSQLTKMSWPEFPKDLPYGLPPQGDGGLSLQTLQTGSEGPSVRGL